MLRHPEDYVTAGLHPWENRFPRGRLPKAELDARYRVQNRTGYVITEATAHLFVRDDEHPYSETQPYTWVRGYQVGGRSLTWGRQSYRHSVMDFEGNAREGVGVDWPIRYRDLAPWYDYVERFIGVSGQSEGLASLPDGVFQPPMDMNCVEVAFKAGVEGRYPERRVTIGRVANLTAPTDEQIALGRGKCQNRNLCMRGCPFGAYFSSNSATLVAAERTGNLTLRPNSIATSVIYDAKKGRATGVQVIDAVTREVLTFQAEVIFVCASSMNSAWILMNSTSARFPEGLGNDSDQLGRNLMDQHSRVGAAADAPGYQDKY